MNNNTQREVNGEDVHTCCTRGFRLRAGVHALLGLITSLCFLGAATLVAQAPGPGAIAGSISDPSGAVIAQAHITVTSEETGSSRAASTTGEGFFRVPLLPP